MYDLILHITQLASGENKMPKWTSKISSNAIGSINLYT